MSNFTHKSVVVEIVEMKPAIKNRKLHLFNPENDVCLGLGNKSYNMPHMVRQLHESGAVLPLWWADADDKVYAPGVSKEWLDAMKSKLPLEAQLLDGNNGAVGYAGMPWGWSHDAKKQLISTGCDVISDDRIERIRMLSHRRTSIVILEKLRDVCVSVPAPLPKEVFTVEEASGIVASYPLAYFKAPWSSSGRGVIAVNEMTEKDKLRIASIIEKQGSIIAEKGLDKKRDFAMLLHADGGTVTFMGYSVFFNERGTAYGGNIVGSNKYLKEILINEGASRAELDAIEQELPLVLEEIIGESYSGYFGVDMLLDEDNHIMPCIELNLRMTMGVVARIFHDRYMESNVHGVYTVTRGNVNMCAPVVRNGKLIGGDLALTPEGEFSFVVKVSQ